VRTLCLICREYFDKTGFEDWRQDLVDVCPDCRRHAKIGRAVEEAWEFALEHEAG
jgi:hypothetical protein